MALTPTAQVWKPSHARRLVLDDFTPRAQGAAAPGPLAWPAKDPADVLDYELDITQALIGNDGDSITAAAISVTPAGPGGLAVNQVMADGRLVVLVLAGGVAGTTYAVQITLSTAAGRSLARVVLLPVAALADPVPALAALTTNTGAAVTDQNGAPILLGV